FGPEPPCPHALLQQWQQVVNQLYAVEAGSPPECLVGRCEDELSRVPRDVHQGLSQNVSGLFHECPLRSENDVRRVLRDMAGEGESVSALAQEQAQAEEPVLIVK